MLHDRLVLIPNAIVGTWTICLVQDSVCRIKRSAIFETIRTCKHSIHLANEDIGRILNAAIDCMVPMKSVYQSLFETGISSTP